MATPEPAPAPDRSARDRLDSWKEIAAYLRRAERTVRRWEQTEGLPVHRHSHQKQASVYAFRAEIDAWLQNRGNRPEGRDEATPQAPVLRLRPRRLLAIALVLIALTAAAEGLRNIWAHWERQPMVTVKPLTSFPGRETYPSLSPDGKQVAFSWAREGRSDSDIYVLEVGGENPRRLTEGPADDIGPVWSPDGRSIAFLRIAVGQVPEIVVAPAAGGPARKVAKGARLGPLSPRFGGWLAWTPDGKWLAASDGPDQGLFLVAVDSGEKRRLTSGMHVSPAFSPDGRSLAFVRVVAGFSDIYVLPLAPGYYPASPPKQITLDRQIAASPAWRADGKAIVFSGGDLWGGRRLYQIDAPGDEKRGTRRTPWPVDLDNSSVVGFSAGASGNHGRLVYEKPLFDVNIWMIDAYGRDGKPQRPRKLIESTRADWSPQFAPDRKSIAFESSRGGRQEIWISNQDGSQARQLTFSGSGSGQPQWSPDGRWIVFTSRAEGRGQIHIVSSGGGKPQWIAHGVTPTWSRDGRRIYFVTQQIMKISVTPPFTSRQDPVPVMAKGAISYESSDGKFLFYTKDGTVWKIPIGGGELQRVLDGVSDWRNWAVVEEGIYFIAKNDTESGSDIRFYRFSTHEIRTVANIDKPVYFGLSASADGRSILYSQIDRDESDLMLAEFVQ